MGPPADTSGVGKLTERARLAELRSYDVLDTPAEPTFDALVRAAAAVAGTPTALVSLLDEDRQWFKARCGLGASETERDVAFCDTVVRSGDALVVTDATADARFATNPLVTGELGIRFYAGFPLRTRAGAVLGSLCVIDYVARPDGLTAEQSDLLRTLTDQVMTLLELRRAVAERDAGFLALGTSEERFRLMFEASPVGQVELDATGRVLRANAAYRDLAVAADPRTVAVELRALAELAAAGGGRFDRHWTSVDGTPVEVEATTVLLPRLPGQPVRVLGTVVDVTERARITRDLTTITAEMAEARDEVEGRNAFMETMLDTLDVGVVACDADGHLTLFNRATREFHGMPADPTIGPGLWTDRFALFDEDGRTPLPVDRIPLVQTLTTGAVHGAVITIKPEGHPARLVRCDGRSILDSNGRLLGAVVAMQDITAVQEAAQALADRERFLRAVLDTAQVAIGVCDGTGRTTYYNDAAERLYGGVRESLTAEAAPDRGVVAGDRAPRPGDGPIHRALKGESVRDVELDVTDPEGTRRSLLVHASPLVGADGAVLGAVGVGHDVTELRASEQRFRAAFFDGPTPMAHLDEQGVLVEVNPALRRFLGRTSARLVGQPLASLAYVDDRAMLRRALAGDGTGSEPSELRFLRLDGTALWCELSASRTVGADGAADTLVQIIDVHARKLHEEALELAAQRDPLTGLANRTVLDARLRSLLEAGARTGTALLFVDLDGFKAINDTHGHEAGDAVLVEVATRLRATVRPDDAVVRAGGDEFVVVCEVADGDPGGVVAALARRVEHAVSAPVEYQGRLLVVGASVGLAHGRAGQDAAALLDAADAAMYARKQERRGGRRRPSRPDGPADAPGWGAQTDRRTSIVDLVGTALAEGRLHVEYQPVVDLRTSRLVGVEALVRMTDRSGRIVVPEAFLDVAEAHGQVGALGEWVLQQAVLQAVAWKRRLSVHDDFAIGVNVSPLQLHGPMLAEAVESALAGSGLDPAALVLEVTEGRLLSDTGSVRQNLERLRELGVHLAVDDFGTGYASPSYLAAFPFDTIKVDRRYTSRLPGTGSAARLADGVFALAAATGLVVVAEGVETEEERDALVGRGVTLAQGYLYARPAPPDRIDQLLPPMSLSLPDQRPPLAALPFAKKS